MSCLDGARAVVTDFGMARQVGERDEGDPQITRDGGVVGTPAYMAPEQIVRQDSSPRRPTSTRWASFCTRYGDRAAAVHRHVDLDGGAAHHRAPLRRAARARPEPRPALGCVRPTCAAWRSIRARVSLRAGEVIAALRGEPRRQARWWLWALPVLMAVVAALVWPRATPHVQGRPSVAVLGFKSLSGQAGRGVVLDGDRRHARRRAMATGEKIRAHSQGEDVACAQRRVAPRRRRQLRRQGAWARCATISSDYVAVGLVPAPGRRRGGEEPAGGGTPRAARSCLAPPPRPAASADLGALVRTVGEWLVVKLGVPEGTGVAGDPWLPRDLARRAALRPRACRSTAPTTTRWRARPARASRDHRPRPSADSTSRFGRLSRPTPAGISAPPPRPSSPS